MEQRRFKRFDIKLPMQLLRNGFQPLSATGQTKNMSSGGVLFTSDAKIEVGEAIEYVIALVGDRESAQPVTLHCLGKVVRLEEAVPQPEEPAWYSHWWLWTAAGVVLAGSVTAAVTLSGGSDGPAPGSLGILDGRR